jgi:hypothetical protein
MSKEEFNEQSVVKSEKQQCIDEDNAKFSEMESLRSSLAAVDPTIFSQLFPGLVLRQLPIPVTTKRKPLTVTNDSIVTKKPKVVVDDFGYIVEDDLTADPTEDCDVDPPTVNPDEEPTEDYARSDETESSSGSSEGHSS